MSDIAIKVENLGKLYRLGEVGTGTLSQDLKRWWALTRGKEDPFAKVGETNDRTKKGGGDFVWALKDVSFEVKEGEVLGIIGRNGAGKSTLLKLLSKVTQPTTGNIKIKGRIASLLEVGTGFHPDLTGRENVFLNGAILGMTKKEIQNKFDEIVDFAGVERYIDTPVKRYSSGMYVRLAFAVAAFLEPEILIIDEVLAVGDAEFQKKCLGRMKDVSVNDGRTVLFVSHNMNAIQELCTECIYMEYGRLLAQERTTEVLKAYLSRAKNLEYVASAQSQSNEVYLKRGWINNERIIEDGAIYLELIVESKIEARASIDLRITSSLSIPVAFSSVGTLDYDELVNIKKGENFFKLLLDVAVLALGDYSLSIDITEPNVKYFDRCNDCLSFEILKADDNDRKLNQLWNLGYVQLPIRAL